MNSFVSFDFDGILHLDVDRHGNPYDFETSDMEPNEPMLKRLREEAKSHRIAIVTARNGWMLDPIHEFVEKHRLPVDRIESAMPKINALHAMGAIRHYDDNPEAIGYVEDDDEIEIIIVPHGKKPPPSKLINKSALELMDDNYEKRRKLQDEFGYPYWRRRPKDDTVLVRKVILKKYPRREIKLGDWVSWAPVSHDYFVAYAGDDYAETCHVIERMVPTNELYDAQTGLQNGDTLVWVGKTVKT
jgi:hypothetical protein